MQNIYTDLALELRELHGRMDGVSESDEMDGEISIKRIGVLDDRAARRIGKAVGSYITLEAPALVQRPPELFDAVKKRLALEIASLIRKNSRNSSALIVGLGNRSVTPDSLGPKVAEHIFVTRHIKQYMPEAFDFDAPSVCAIAPGVLGVTGVETLDMVRGAVQSARPGFIIAIDSLASRRAARISSTIQISDAGISPGSGVGNLRSDISESSLGVPVIAIGVPLVVRAATISQDTISLMASETGLHGDEERLRTLAERIAEKQLDDMIVTPKDVDIIVDDMARIIADAINSAIFGENLDKIRDLIA